MRTKLTNNVQRKGANAVSYTHLMCIRDSCVACVLVSALALRVVFYMTGISIYPFF